MTQILKDPFILSVCIGLGALSAGIWIGEQIAAPPEFERHPLIELYGEEAVLCATVSDGFVLLYLTPHVERPQDDAESSVINMSEMSPNDRENKLAFAEISGLDFFGQNQSNGSTGEFMVSGIKVVCHPNQRSYSP